MKICNLAIFAFLTCFLVFSACRTVPGVQAGRNFDREAVSMAVLAYMVTNADTSNKLVRFVEVQEPVIQQLRNRCGNRYIIEPVSVAVRKSGALEDGAVQQSEGIYLRNSSKEGVLLHIELTGVGSTQAEAIGTYQGRLSGAGFRYKLKRTPQGWAIMSVESIASI